MTVRSVEGSRYYAAPAVQLRVREYCGSCSWVSQLAPDGHVTWAIAPRFATADLPRLFDAGWDLSRSVLDTESLMVFFEVDVGDPDAPEDALLRPAQAFFDLEPVYRAITAELTRIALPLLDVMTGRGYHFSGRVRLDSPLIDRLAALAPPEDNRTDRANTGLGMALEHLAHCIVRQNTASRVPLVIDGVEVGRGGAGRQAASLDLSGFGDPLGERQMRSAFSTYQTHRIRPDIFGTRAASEVPALAAIPRRGRPLLWMLEHARNVDDAQALAREETALIPEVGDGVARLLDEYGASALAAFHRAFYEEPACGPDGWREESTELDVVPCVAHALRHPNDALLKPTVLQHLTRYLMAQGWTPRRIASLVWSRYAADHGWGPRWRQLDPQRRAEFDVRVFAGAIVTGIDRLIDFNCVSNQEKRLCPRTGCTHDLRDERNRLLERVAS